MDRPDRLKSSMSLLSAAPAVVLAAWGLLPAAEGQATATTSSSSATSTPTLSIGTIPTLTSCGSALITWDLVNSTPSLAKRRLSGRQTIDEALYVISLRVSNIGVDQTIPSSSSASSSSAISSSSSASSSSSVSTSSPVSSSAPTSSSSVSVSTNDPSSSNLPTFASLPTLATSSADPTTPPTLVSSSSTAPSAVLAPATFLPETIDPVIITTLTGIDPFSDTFSTSSDIPSSTSTEYEQYTYSPSAYSSSSGSISSASSGSSSSTYTISALVPLDSVIASQAERSSRPDRSGRPHHSRPTDGLWHTKRATDVNLTLSTNQPANQFYTFNPVNLPAGRYQLVATVNTTNTATARSNIFTVVQGSDTSCLSVTTNSGSSATPTASLGINTSASTGSSSTDRSLSGGAIAGIVIGVVAFFVIIGLLVLCCVRRRRNRREAPVTSSRGIEHLAPPMSSRGGAVTRQNGRIAALGTGLGITTAHNQSRPVSPASQTGTFGRTPTSPFGDGPTEQGDIARPSSMIFPVSRFDSAVDVSSVHSGDQPSRSYAEIRSSASHGSTALAIAAYGSALRDRPASPGSDDAGLADSSEEESTTPAGLFTVPPRNEDLNPFNDRPNEFSASAPSTPPAESNDPFRKGPVAILGRSQMFIPASPSSPPMSSRPTIQPSEYPSRAIPDAEGSDESETSHTPPRDRQKRKPVPAFIDLNIGGRKDGEKPSPMLGDYEAGS